MTQAASRRRPPQPPSRSRRSRSRRTSWWPFAVVAAVVVVAGVIAIVASSGDDDDSGGSSVATGSQTASVEITGTALAATPENATGLVDPATDPAVGQVAPTVKGVSFDGTPVTVGGAGRPTIVLFVAHWCPHCQKEVPLVQKWRTDGSLSADVDWVTVSTSVSSSADNYPPSAWLAREGWSAPVLADSEDFSTARAYGLQSFPYFVALKADGTVAARAIGELAVAQVRTLVAAASATS